MACRLHVSSKTGALRVYPIHRSTDHLHVVPSCTPRDPHPRADPLCDVLPLFLPPLMPMHIDLFRRPGTVAPTRPLHRYALALPKTSGAPPCLWRPLLLRPGRLDSDADELARATLSKPLMQGVPCSGTIGWLVALTDSSTQSRFPPRAGRSPCAPATMVSAFDGNAPISSTSSATSFPSATKSSHSRSAAASISARRLGARSYVSRPSSISIAGMSSCVPPSDASLVCVLRRRQNHAT